ncbi:MAG TPA: ABC transporter ATP-binding protein [Gemmataceae bacterium]|nr:ABC transporter ATP-binding protein [Gemmataceae bacterium]
MRARKDSNGFSAEFRLILRSARQVWHLGPHRHKAALGAAVLVMAVTSACCVAIPQLLGRLVDRVQSGVLQGWSGDAIYRTAAWSLGLLALLYFIREGLHVLRRYLVENTCTRVSRDMSVQLVAHLLKVDLATFTQEKVGALHGRIFRSVDGFVRFLRVGFLDFFPALMTGAFALTAVLGKEPFLGLVMLGVIPVSVFLTVRQLISQKGVRLDLLRACEDIDGAVVEQLGGIEYIRAADTHRQEVARLAHATERRRKKEIRHHFQMSLFGCGKALNEAFFHLLVIACAIYCAASGTISFGDVLTLSMLFLNVMTPLSEIHRVLDEGHEASLRVGDLLEMLAEPVDRSFAIAARREPRLEPGQPVIEVDALRFHYRTPDGQVRRALNGVSLSIRHGETIGVAGRSGSGKSTWLKCLLRLPHPVAGTGMLGGVPLEAVTREDIARLIGYVGQTPFVFAGSIAENIAYGNDGVTREDIRRAARLAHLDEEILAMPGSYDAAVTERGSNLSGGQRQRLAIARILLKNPPILILDEATSALDNISERHVQRSLGLTSADRTTILVAHRLTTLRDADRIVVFDNGQIIETGTFDELVRRGGVFTELVMSAEHGVLADAAPPQVPVAA